MSRKRDGSRSGRQRSPARQRTRRARWLVIGATTLALVAAVALAVSQGGGGTELAAERHVLGDPQAPVTVLEWADFQ